MDEAKLAALIEGLERIRDFPPKGYPRRDDEGYPMEMVYDEFAYKRMIDTYRDAAKTALRRAGISKRKAA